MTWVGTAIAGGGALYGAISGNQSRQQQKGLQGKQLSTAETQYADRAPYRNAAKEALLSPTQYDFSADYVNPANPYSDVGGRFVPITSGKYTGNVDTAAKALESGPDRVGMAKQALADFDVANQPGLDARFRKVGQKAASLGRIGAGGVASELGTLQGDYERDRGLTERDLIRGLTEADANDRFRKLNAFQDLNQTELAGQRGERAYGAGLGEQAITNRERARNAAAKATGLDLSRGMDLATLGAGSDRAITDAYGTAAGQEGQRADAATAGAGDLFGLAGDLYARGRYKPVANPSTTATSPAGYPYE